MKVDINIGYLDRPNLNGVMYTKEAIKTACEKLQETEIPVVYVAEDTFEFSDLIISQIDNYIGTAKLVLESYPDIQFTANITNERFCDMLRNGWGGFGPNSIVTMVEDEDTTYLKTVKDANIKSIGYSIVPATNSKYKISED